MVAKGTTAEPLSKHNTDPTNTRYAAPASRNKVSRSIAIGEMAINCPDDGHLYNKQRITTFHIPATFVQPPASRRNPPSTICYRKEHLLTTNTSIVEICSKRTYTLRISCCVDAASIYTATYLFDTEAGINVVSLTLHPLQ